MIINQKSVFRKILRPSYVDNIVDIEFFESAKNIYSKKLFSYIQLSDLLNQHSFDQVVELNITFFSRF